MDLTHIYVFLIVQLEKKLRGFVVSQISRFLNIFRKSFIFRVVTLKSKKTVVGMSICSKMYLNRSISNSCVIPVKGKYTENQNFQKILKMWFKCPLVSKKRYKTFWKCSGVFGDVKMTLEQILGGYTVMTRSPPPGGVSISAIWVVFLLFWGVFAIFSKVTGAIPKHL